MWIAKHAHSAEWNMNPYITTAGLYCFWGHHSRSETGGKYRSKHLLPPILNCQRVGAMLRFPFWQAGERKKNGSIHPLFFSPRRKKNNRSVIKSFVIFFLITGKRITGTSIFGLRQIGQTKCPNFKLHRRSYADLLCPETCEAVSGG